MRVSATTVLVAVRVAGQSPTAENFDTLGRGAGQRLV